MTSPELMSWNMAEVKVDLIRASRDCRDRGLTHSAKWAAELNFSLKTPKTRELDIAMVHVPPSVDGKVKE